MKTKEKNRPGTPPRFLTLFGMTIVVVLCLCATELQAGEVRLNVGDSAFVANSLPNGRHFEAFRFNLPEIPQGARIDFAALILSIERDSIDPNDTLKSPYLPLALLPITSDWSRGSVERGQILAVDGERACIGVANSQTGDTVVMDITFLVASWLKGERVNRGFMLVPEISNEKTEFAVGANAGVKAEVVVYYTGPEVER